MNRETMRLRVAKNINQLSSDGSTFVDGIVTASSVNNQIDDIYREELFPLFSDKFPRDFEQVTYPISTYTATSTVSSSSTGTTLVASNGIFDNTMEGFTVYNATDDESTVIETYNSPTTVTVDASIGDDWDGDTIYILGDTYTFGGQAVDLKEIKEVMIKYSPSDTYYTRCLLESQEDLYQIGSESYSKSLPRFSPTTVDVNDTPTPAIKFTPNPDSYEGKFKIRYIEKPPALTDSTEPTLKVAGISKVIINGTTAWALGLQKRWEDANVYQTLYERGKIDLIRNYKPVARSGPSRIRQSNYMSALRLRNI